MSSLAALLTLSDSRLPTGGHVHSGGVEEAITSGLVMDLVTLRAFLRRRIRTHGLVTASVAAAVHAGTLSIADGDRETDARTPAPAARSASRAQGRGLTRLARRAWPDRDWAAVGVKPHLAVAAGEVGAASGLMPEQTALSVVYTTMTGSATAAQRLLALDPGDVAAVTFELSARRPRSSPTCPTHCSTHWPSGTPNANGRCSYREVLKGEPCHHICSTVSHTPTPSGPVGSGRPESRCASASAAPSAPARRHSWPRCADNCATSYRSRC
jgi:urease accessory protein